MFNGLGRILEACQPGSVDQAARKTEWRVGVVSEDLEKFDKAAAVFLVQQVVCKSDFGCGVCWSDRSEHSFKLTVSLQGLRGRREIVARAQISQSSLVL